MHVSNVGFRQCGRRCLLHTASSRAMTIPDAGIALRNGCPKFVIVCIIHERVALCIIPCARISVVSISMDWKSRSDTSGFSSLMLVTFTLSAIGCPSRINGPFTSSAWISYVSGGHSSPAAFVLHVTVFRTTTLCDGLGIADTG